MLQQINIKLPTITTNHSPRDSAQNQMFSGTLKMLPHFEEALCMFPPKKKPTG